VMEELLAVAGKQGIAPTEMSFIIATVEGEFGTAVLDAGPGVEFVMTADDGTETAVVPLGVDGLVVIMHELVPEGVEHVLMRAAGTLPILVVDHRDEPAIVVMAIEELLLKAAVS
jgi:hypothetical protein